MASKTKKIIFSVFAFLILASGIVAGVYLVQKDQDIREKAAPATSLSFIPSSVTRNPGQTLNLTVNANTGENKITGIDIEISFDPAVIQLSEMDPMPAISPLSTVIKNGVIDNTTGKARYAAFTINRDDAVFGSLDVLSLTGTIVNSAVSGSSEVSFTTLTTISAVDEGVNVIVNKSSATVNVSSGSTQSTATASPTAAGTAVATASPAPTATGGVGGAGITTATPIPTRTPTVAPTTNATTEPVETLPPDVPVTGVSLPLMGTVTLGLGAIILSLFLAF